MADRKRVQFGNEGEELVPGKTENLSSVRSEQGDAQNLDAKLKPEGRKLDDDDIVKDEAPADPDASTRRAVNDPANTGGGHSGA